MSGPSPVRYTVELRPPRKGERYVMPHGVRVCDWEPMGACWVVVDPVPADPDSALTNSSGDETAPLRTPIAQKPSRATQRPK